MAAFLLYLGAPPAVLIHGAMAGRRAADDVVDVEASEVEALAIDVDPYVTHRAWSAAALGELVSVLETRLAEWQQAAHDAVLRTVRRTTIEPWMMSMLEARLAEDRRVAIARSLVALVRRAMAADGALVYAGD